eukprot:TRINITY_DN29070_c0_g1_i1.p1 TRINITY_DN29070_c0_g1~~TRINITY_DN29070_c0_g1_i1.p1  ORF type:complete len:110 (-),score=2.84 TRINITY_DN29070_c0_g1_i1:466-795(-)
MARIITLYFLCTRTLDFLSSWNACKGHFPERGNDFRSYLLSDYPFSYNEYWRVMIKCKQCARKLIHECKLTINKKTLFVNFCCAHLGMIRMGPCKNHPFFGFCFEKDNL